VITEISIENFKCFLEKETFSFSKINLLTGINGRGKSSLLQSLLLLSQTFRNKTPQQLLINGEWVELGTYDDIKNSQSTNKTITFHIKTDDTIDNDLKFEYGEFSDNERFATLNSLFIDGKNKFEEISANSDISSKRNVIKRFKLSPLEGINTLTQFQKFHFIAADRLGPIEYVKKKDTPDSINVGIRGENLLNVLAYHGDIMVYKSLCFGRGKAILINQTIKWLSFILDGANIDIKGVKQKASSIISLLLNSKNIKQTYKPVNVGFGYSYILPLIVTGLIAKKGDIVIVENPEAHLHPRAQARLTEFFVKVASCGIQVFIESHSEHILNRLRVCAINPDISINFDEVVIHYFDEFYKSEKLEMNNAGKILNWPTGFFDQQEIDLANIFKFSK
jgi:predicted ATPase